MKKLIAVILGILVLAMYAKQVQAADLYRGTDAGGPRDRINAFCDPAANPRELRGEYIDCGTSVEPTTAPSPDNQPSPVPTSGGGNGGGTGGVPTAVPTRTTDSGSSNDDPCASGKPYTGDYCGWSPRVGGDPGNTNTASLGESNQIGPVVKGLSYTASPDLVLSDIILLLGVLCLLLYVKSKIELKISR
jgi:hypothetical protein